MNAEDNKRKDARRLTIIWLLIALLVVAGGTFAWFTFQTSTNVEPGNGGTVTSGGGDLQISNSASGPFGDTCELILESDSEKLEPISSSTANTFYKSAKVLKGISILYSYATDDVDNCTMHGKIYLKTSSSSTNVYLYISKMTFGDDIQAIAAMRLALKITTADGTYNYIFKLDDMKDTSSADKKVTTPTENVVVESISSSGVANYVTDASLNLSDYTATGGSSIKEVTPGKNKLFTLKSGDVAKVEYMLYLEGCDVHCWNAVQNKDVAFSLCFAGNSAK